MRQIQGHCDAAGWKKCPDCIQSGGACYCIRRGNITTSSSSSSETKSRVTNRSSRGPGRGGNHNMDRHGEPLDGICSHQYHKIILSFYLFGTFPGAFLGHFTLVGLGICPLQIKNVFRGCVWAIYIAIELKQESGEIISPPVIHCVPFSVHFLLSGFPLAGTHFCGKTQQIGRGKNDTRCFGTDPSSPALRFQ